MTPNTRLAGQVHHWLIAEGKDCESDTDLRAASDRFLERWPRVRPEVLLYVSQMLIAELHVRTFRASQILDRARSRSMHEPHLLRRRSHIGWSGSGA